MSVVDIVIDKPVGPQYFNAYVIEVRFSFGRDTYTFETKTIEFPADKKDLAIAFLNWLPYASEALSDDDVTFEDVYNYNKFANEHAHHDECDEHGVDFEFYGLDGWPFDINDDCGELFETTISYYDGNGQKFAAKLIKE
ncbi:hypothetical protein D3C75_745380 [compost metagenome]